MMQEKIKTLVIFDIDGVIRDVSGSYRRAIADTVEHFTNGNWRPIMTDIDRLKGEGIWNNDWEASCELIYRYWESQGQDRAKLTLDYNNIVAFFQTRYRGNNWDGYIAREPLLVSNAYFNELTAGGVGWGFFSGATRGSAEYILKKRLGLSAPILIAMEDAPGKPDPTGLFATIQHLEQKSNQSSLIPVIYVGDTVADMYTVTKAREIQPERCWLGVGVLPPHVQSLESRQTEYSNQLQQAGATVVLSNVEELQPTLIEQLTRNNEPN
jgi:HAD superfamily phosphatase